jgi:TM2 domain-containing membrane protein YozV
MIDKHILLALIAGGAFFLASGEGPVVVQAADRATQTAAHSTREEGAVVLKPKIATYDYDAIPKDPLASMLLSVVLPGSGQIYNKEYGRGIITGVLWYGSLAGMYLLIDKWTRINTDTIHLAEADPVTGLPNGSSRDVYVMRDPDKQVGLPAGDKVLLVGAIAIAATSYVFGIIDSYRGAQRYNKKLLESQQLKLGLIADPVDRKIGMTASLRF